MGRRERDIQENRSRCRKVENLPTSHIGGRLFYVMCHWQSTQYGHLSFIHLSLSSILLIVVCKATAVVMADANQAALIRRNSIAVGTYLEQVDSLLLKCRSWNQYHHDHFIAIIRCTENCPLAPKVPSMIWI